jgi:hypothetical protein
VNRIFVAAPGVAISLSLALAQGVADVQADHGGAIRDYVRFVEQTYHTHQLLEIRGRCYSACTIELGAENVCIAEDAILFFHSANVSLDAYDSGNDAEALVTLRYIVAAGNRDMLKHYPPRIRRWVQQRHALTKVDFTPMSGREAIRLGVKECRK